MSLTFLREGLHHAHGGLETLSKWSWPRLRLPCSVSRHFTCGRVRILERARVASDITSLNKIFLIIMSLYTLCASARARTYLQRPELGFTSPSHCRRSRSYVNIAPLPTYKNLLGVKKGCNCAKASNKSSS